MPSLKEFRVRIASVKSTQKITKAMQLVAAAKLKRANDAAVASRAYADRIAAVVANLAAGVTAAEAPPLLKGTGKDEVRLLVVATAERGLCGGFNGNIVRMARTQIREIEAAGKTLKILTIGRKGREALRRTHAHAIIDHVDFSGRKSLSAEDAQAIGAKLRALYAEGAFDVCTLVFSRYRSVVSQIPTAQQILPAVAPEGTPAPDLKGAVYAYEPSQEAILDQVLPRYLDSQIFRALLENAVGEQGARMAAMDAATRNAGELIKKLTLRYNRQRQANITKELIEIISGAEAL